MKTFHSHNQEYGFIRQKMEKRLYETRQGEWHDQMHIHLKINSGYIEKGDDLWCGWNDEDKKKKGRKVPAFREALQRRKKKRQEGKEGMYNSDLDYQSAFGYCSHRTQHSSTECRHSINSSWVI